MNHVPSRLVLAIVVVLAWYDVLCTSKAAAQGNLVPSFTISRVNQGVLVSWFAENEVVYQLEASTDLRMWGNLGSQTLGSGNTVTFQFPTVGQSRFFFRLKLPGIQSASFDSGTGTLKIIGDNVDNLIVVSCDAAGKLLINNGSVAISGGTPTVSNTTVVQIYGREGADQISLDEAGGALPRAELHGEGGDDTLTGGSGNDFLDGGPGDDTLLGKGGTDTLVGGDNNDTLLGGHNDDQLFGDAGNDRFIWNPGDDTDVNEGGVGNDTVEINGGNGAEVFAAQSNGSGIRFDRTSPAPFHLDINTCEFLVLNANGGNDQFFGSNGLAPLIAITVDGGSGEDILFGGDGADLLIGGDDNDLIDGNRGNDTILLGDGDDTFQWDPGDGSDTVEGQTGIDRFLFNGANVSENLAVSAIGGRVRFTRDVAAIVTDLDDVEILEVNMLGGADIFTINDLSGTDLTSVIADLAATGGAGDAQADTVNINGTPFDDIITATMPGGDLFVTGLPASILVDGFESANDVVRIQSAAGDDIVDASGIAAGGPVLVIDGGAGNDILLGSVGNDTLIGGDNDDVLLGFGGVDVLDGSAGNNTSIQDATNITSGILTIFGDGLDNTITISRDVPGNILSNGVPIPGATTANTSLIRIFGMTGNDTITLNEANGPLPPAMLFGGPGIDTLTGGSGGDLLFGGSDNDALLGKGGFDYLFGGAGNDTLTGGDADDQAFGEGDNDRIVWNPGDDSDLNEGAAGNDTVEVNGGNGDEQFTTTANGTRVRFDRINPAPFALDIGTCESLVVNANGGNDTFSATGNLAPLIAITVDGGPGDDTLLGSNGPDVLLGGDNNDFVDGNQGNDSALLGAGNDTFQWDPGDGSDTVEGQGDHDVILFNGANVAETLTFSANGPRLLFTRNVGNVSMDANDVEQFDVRALGGADVITIHDLSGTDLTRVNLDLASTVGGASGDAQADAITVNGTASPDIIDLGTNGGAVELFGLAAQVRITRPEVGNDTLTVNGLGGSDTFNVGAGVTSLIQLTTNQ